MTSAAAVDDGVAELAPTIIEAVNETYGDAVLLIGRALGQRPGASATRVVALDRTGADFVVTDVDGEHVLRCEFEAELADAATVTSALFALVRRARVESGETGTTSAERVMAELSGIRTFVTSVVRVEEVHPHLRRIVFGGGDLAGFTPVGPDTFVYVLLPPSGRTELTVDATFSWEAHRVMPEEERAVGAYYTVRRWDPLRCELEVLFVLHGDEGHASAWAGRAAGGDPVALWGPRTSYAPPTDTERYLLVADDTGLPAVAAIVESLPAQVPVRVLAEVGSAEEHQPLPERETVDVTWLHRDGRPAGTTTLLADAVKGLRWPDGPTYAWGGGESRAMTDVRAHLRRVIGLRRDQVSMVAYWRHDGPS